MTELTYRTLELSDIKKIEPLHMKSLQEGLLYEMGEKYIGLLYINGLKSGNSFGFIAENEKKEIVGMAFATHDIYKLMLQLMTSPTFVTGLARKIFQIRKLYPSLGKKPHVRQEFLMLFIEQKYRNLKTALRLMQLIDEKYEKLGVKKYSLEVEEKNTTANMLYQYFGFKKTHEVGHEGSKRIFYIKDTGGLHE